jgi:hypothetical protein
MRTYFPPGSAAENRLFEDWKTDVDGHNVWIYKRVNFMRGSIYGKTMNLMAQVPGIWNRTVLTEPQYLQVDRKHDCSYEVSFLSLQVPTNVQASLRTTELHKLPRPAPGDEFEVLFNIRQFDCVSKCQVLGGSSFQVFTRFGVFLPRNMRTQAQPGSNDNSNPLLMYQLSQSIIAKCYIDDHFSNSYTVRCGFNVHSFLPYSLQNAMYCMNASFTVDYEHFDAFSELRLPHQSMLRIRIPATPHAQDTINVVNSNSASGKVPTRYRMLQVPMDKYHNYVTCFEPIHTNGNNGGNSIEATASSEQGVSFLPHYSSYGVWREVFTPPSEISPSSMQSTDVSTANTQAPVYSIPSRLPETLDRVFDLHRQFLVNRAAMAAINPSDLHYCGNTSLVDDSQSTKPKRKIAVLPSTLDNIASLNNQESRVSTAFMFERRREFVQWTGIGNKFLSKEHVLRVSEDNKMDLLLIGESHMRYLWDFIARLYFFHKGDFSLLSQKHQDVIFIKEAIFLHRLFIPTLSDSLDDVTELMTKYYHGARGYNLNQQDMPNFHYYWYSNATIKTVAIQFGAWDLDTFPVRGTMDSPSRGLPRFMSALLYNVEMRTRQVDEDTMRHRGKDGAKSTVGPVHLLILNVYPHYTKVGHNVTGGWKNNFAIQAVNQKLFQMMIKFLDPKEVHGPYSPHKLLTTFDLPAARMKITLFNAYEMMIQHAELFSGVCGDHTLCHIGDAGEQAGGYTRLRSGLVQINMMLLAAFDSVHVPQTYDKEAFNSGAAELLYPESVAKGAAAVNATKDKNIDIDKVRTQERIDELFLERPQEYRESTIICVNQTADAPNPSRYAECYLIINGLKQPFPDEETLFYTVRTRLEQCISQTLFIPASAAAVPSADFTDALMNESAIICDNMVGFGAIDFSKTKHDIQHISALFPMFSMKPPLFNHSAHSYCAMAVNDADYRDGAFGMSVQDGRKHKVVLPGEWREFMRWCPPDEIMPQGEQCSPNPIVTTNGQLVFCPPDHKRYYMYNGKKEYISPFYQKYHGWKDPDFLYLDNFDLMKVIETGPWYSIKGPLQDNITLQAFEDPDYYFIKGGKRHHLTKELYNSFPDEWRLGVGPVTKEYLENIPLGAPMTIRDLYPSMPDVSDGTLLACNKVVYYIINSTRRYVTGPVFNELKFSFDNVKHMSCEDLRKIPEVGGLAVEDVRSLASSGPTASAGAGAGATGGGTIEDYTVVQCDTKIPTFYAVVNMTRHTFTVPISVKRQFSMKKVLVMDCHEMEKIPLGDPLTE